MRAALGYVALVLVVVLFPVRPVLATDTLRVAVQQEPGTLNPVIGTLAVEIDAYNLLFDGLFRNDDHGNLVPDLATRVPTQQNRDISRDGLTITYRLVRNAKWHDGQPVTSDDVKFTFDSIMDPRNNVVTRIPYDQFAKVDTPDPYTVVVHLKQPYAPAVVQAFTTYIQGAIIPAHILRGVSDFNHSSFGTSPVGSGPYKLVAWHHGNDMIFEVNPAYHRRSPSIRRIVWHFTPSDNTIISELRSHEIDLVDKLGVTPYSQLGSIPGYLPALGPSTFWEHLTFNAGSGPLQDVRVRRALCEGFDVREIYAKVVHGIGDLGVGLQSPKTAWYDRSLQPCRHDPDEARRLLDQAGWHIAANGMRARDGKPLQITFTTVAGILDREQTAVILQSRWREIGVDTQIKAFPPATFFAPAQTGGIFYGGKFDVALSAFTLRSFDPSRTSFDTSAMIPPAGQNTAYWRNSRVDALEEQGVRVYDESSRRRIYDEVQRIEARELPYVIMRWWTLISMRDVRLHGLRPTPVGSLYWNVSDWTFE
jgi:peptide/nickel transport system substrate-binding protein